MYACTYVCMHADMWSLEDKLSQDLNLVLGTESPSGLKLTYRVDQLDTES